MAQASANDLQMMLDALNGDGLCKAVAVYCSTFFHPETNALSIGVMNLEKYFVHRTVCRACIVITTKVSDAIAASYEVNAILEEGMKGNGRTN